MSEPTPRILMIEDEAQMRRLGDLDIPLMATAFVEGQRLDGAYAVQGLDEK